MVGAARKSRSSPLPWAREAQRRSEATEPDAFELVSQETLKWRRQLARNPLVRLLRLSRRVRVCVDATLVVRSLALPVVVRDVSRYGALLEGVGGLEPDQPVSLEAIGGSMIAANVRWNIGDRLGVEFVDPMADLGPFVGGQQQAEASGLESVAAYKPSDALAGVTGPRGAPKHPRGGVSSATVERACRKQGFSWLAEEDKFFSGEAP